MNLIAVGDVHGCPDTLDVLLDRLELDAEDHLVFVGDYIDRGPNSKRVIERLLALSEEQACTFLRGNHEALMLDYLDGGTGGVHATRALRLWQQNGGGSTLRSYANGQAAHLPEAHVAFVRATKLYHETPDFFFVHAGIKAERTIRENIEREDDQTFLWERGHLEAPQLAWEKPIVCGHTPRRQPVSRDKLIAIDTGCVYHQHPGLGRLTAVRLPEREFVSVRYQG
jgi:serine/threonine protein phosphatase 1